MRDAVCVIRLTTASLIAALAGPAVFGQSAYFSLTGELIAGGDQYDMNFDLTRSVGSGEDLRFLTFGDSVATNAAGDGFADIGYDGDLLLFNGLNVLRGGDDLSGPQFDALLTWGIGSVAPLSPNPLPADTYRLNVREFGNNQSAAFGVDLIGPDDAIVFTGANPVNTAVLNTLKFGSNDGGTAVYNHSVGTFDLTGEMVVANTGNANLNLSGGTINVGGQITVNIDGDIVQNGGALNANGGMLIDGGSYTRTAGTFGLAAGQNLTVQNGGLFNATPPNAPQLVVGTAGASLTTQGAITLVDGEVRFDGGKGGLAGFNAISPDAKKGGAGGSVTVSGGGVELIGNSVFQARGGAGGNGTFLRDPAVGGVGGVIEVSGGAVSVNDNSTLSVRGGDAGTGTINFPPRAGGAGGQINVTSGSLTVNDGLVTLRGGNGFAGGGQGANGSINITGGSFTLNGGEVFTGSFTSAAGLFTHNEGKLTVAGGTFDAGAPGYVLSGANLGPTLVLTDGATAPGLTGIVRVGDATNGRLELHNGAQLNTGPVTVGDRPGSNGEVAIEGPGTKWEQQPGSFYFAVGNEGDGEAVVGNQSEMLVSGILTIGRLASGEGTVDVIGGATLRNGGNILIVGETGKGTLNATSGGRVLADFEILVGGVVGGEGLLVADGAGTLVDVGTNMKVGGSQFGNGTSGELRVQNDAVVNVGGTLEIFGPGTINFAGGTLTADTIDDTRGGAFNFTGGTLVVNTYDGDLNQQGGTVAPGASPGRTFVTGSYNMNASSTLAIEIGGLAPATGYDQVETALQAFVDGTIDLSLINGFVPADYDSFEVVSTGGGVVGTFDTVAGINYGVAGRGLAVTYGFDEVFVTAALLGDTDLDGDVDDADLGTAFSKYTGPAGVAGGRTWADGDTDGDGDVDDADLGSTFGGFTGPLTNSVPEPTAGWLVIAGLTLLGRRRRPAG